MNYRHIYHAGNFADVVKHAVLALVIEKLKLKDTAFRVIDTHAGAGIYDLSAPAAERTGEWIGGIGRLIGPGAQPLPAPQATPVAELLRPYLDAVGSFNPPGLVRRYPGSPRIARALMRPQDRLVVNELHPEDAAALRAGFRNDPQVKVMAIDGWAALKALLPPIERRGVVLIDPPFEIPGEQDRLLAALAEAGRRFAHGIYLLWYPLKDLERVSAFKADLAATGLPKLLAVELSIRPPTAKAALTGTGLAILNPPYGLDHQLNLLLPFLASVLELEAGGGWSLEWLTREP